MTSVLLNMKEKYEQRFPNIKKFIAADVTRNTDVLEDALKEIISEVRVSIYNDLRKVAHFSS